MPNSFKRVTTLCGLAGFLLLTAPCQALNFTWSFVNSSGNIGATTDVAAGTILGLNEGANFQAITVTFDTINGLAPAGAVVADSWTTNVNATVTAGAITSIFFSGNAAASTITGTQAIGLNTGGTNNDFVASAGWGSYYLSGSDAAFAPLNVPDGGTSLMLLGLGIGGLAIMRRRLA